MGASLNSLDEVIAEMLRLKKTLPPRPSFPELELALATIAKVDETLATKQADLLRQPRPPDVPPSIFAALQEMCNEALSEHATEKKRAAEAVIELEQRHRKYDEWIQQAHSALLDTGPSLRKPTGGEVSAPTTAAGSARSVLDADWDLGALTSASATPGGSDDQSEKSQHLSKNTTSPKMQLTALNLNRSLSWSSHQEEKLSKGSVVSLVNGKGDGERPQDNSLALAEEGNGMKKVLGVLSMLDIASKEEQKKLDLHGAFLKEIEWVPESLGKMTWLTELDLSGNRLTILPDSIGNLCNLVHLNASSNQLIALPDTIGNLTCLEILNIENNKIEELPYTIGQCTRLNELISAFNQLKALPEATGKLSQLRLLDVHLNNLASLPTTMASMTSLTELDAHFNQIQSIPESLCQVTTLTRLNLSSNFTELKELPQQIGNLQKLKVLNLSCNQITVLPDSFAMLTNLQELDLSGNPMRIPPPDVVEKGTEAVLKYMADRITANEQRKPVKSVVREKSIWDILLFACVCGKPSRKKEMFVA